MTALANKRQIRLKKFSTIEMAATASVTYYQGALLCLDTSTGLIVQGKASTTLIPVGLCAESTTLGASGGNVPVNLFREIVGAYFVNSGSDAISTVGGLAYIVDDQTVGNTDQTNTLSVLGRVWVVSATKGVLVEPVQTGIKTNSGLDF